jgi:light-regulated signal transduction histidine kinase (bacteriophytochrome)
MLCETEQQAHRDALLHESYSKQSGYTKDGLVGNVNDSSGAFDFVTETIKSFSQEATATALEIFSRYMTQPGRVQSHGVYLLADEQLDNRIIACSTNTEKVFGCHPSSILGASLFTLFEEGSKLETVLRMPDLTLANPVILTCSPAAHQDRHQSQVHARDASSHSPAARRRPVNAILHRTDEGLIVDVEDIGDEAVEGAWQVLCRHQSPILSP